MLILDEGPASAAHASISFSRSQPPQPAVALSSSSFAFTFFGSLAPFAASTTPLPLQHLAGARLATMLHSPAHNATATPAAGSCLAGLPIHGDAPPGGRISMHRLRPMGAPQVFLAS